MVMIFLITMTLRVFQINLQSVTILGKGRVQATTDIDRLEVKCLRAISGEK